MNFVRKAQWNRQNSVEWFDVEFERGVHISTSMTKNTFYLALFEPSASDLLAIALAALEGLASYGVDFNKEAPEGSERDKEC